MNSKVLMVLAGLLLVGAVLLGYLGVSIGRAPSTVQVPAVAPATSVVDASLEKLERKPVLVASRDLPALAVIGKDDLVVEMLRTAPAGSYDKPEALLGKRVWVAVPAGTARPFRQDAGRAYGPGVADAKGGVAMVLHALALLKQQGFKDYGRITVLFNPDEETGSAGSRQLIAELARQQDYVFSYEPPDRDAVTIATNGINGLFLDVKGRASHAGSAPEQGRNALLELSHQLLRLKDLGDPAKGTTVNWTLASSGEKRNIIPAEASAEADMRYSDPAESERVLADARKLIGERLVAGTQVSVRLDKGRPPLVKNPASQRLAETAQVLYSRIGKRIEPVAMRFGTDAGYAYQPGSDGPAVLETLGVVGAGLHSEAEYLELSSIAPRLYLTVALIRSLSAE
ncbi:glutamate carboxypeptidase [Pseudomonas aeruginosa VRFPA01]|nr:glutamate carboxypeptidase [Pseudomonas aeruginosa VRFPA01]